MDVDGFLNKYKKDIILIVLVVVLGLALFTGVRIFKGTGNTVTVRVDGTAAGEYQLSEDGEYEISGYKGSSNYLIIKDNSAYMSRATCPDKLCVSMGKISRRGESIVCLPNRVVVEIN